MRKSSQDLNLAPSTKYLHSSWDPSKLQNIQSIRPLFKIRSVIRFKSERKIASPTFSSSLNKKPHVIANSLSAFRNSGVYSTKPISVLNLIPAKQKSSILDGKSSTSKKPKEKSRTVKQDDGYTWRFPQNQNWNQPRNSKTSVKRTNSIQKSLRNTNISQSVTFPAGVKSDPPGLNQVLRVQNSLLFTKGKDNFPKSTIPVPASGQENLPEQENLNDSENQITKYQEQELDRVKEAIKLGHIFEIRGSMNCVDAARTALLQRGWIEKIKERSKTKLPVGSQNSKSKVPYSCSSVYSGGKMLCAGNSFVSYASSVETNQTKELVQKLLESQRPNLIWVDHNRKVKWTSSIRGVLINRHPQGAFAEKKPLTKHLQSFYWVGSEGDSVKGTTLTNFACISPRTYRLYDEEEKESFIQDYRLTACLSFLKWFKKSIDDGIVHLPRTPHDNKRCVLCLLSFALDQVKHYTSIRKHEDLDLDTDQDATKAANSNANTDNILNNDINKDMDWDTFFSDSRSRIHYAIKSKYRFDLRRIDPTDGEAYSPAKVMKLVRTKYDETKVALQKVEPFWPQSNIDGIRNVWLFKPAYGSCGKGIEIMDDYQTIFETFLSDGTGKKRLIQAQKYIESPLLVHKTKFDIRLWFLITSWNPIVAWIYKKCYLRFSSKVFSLDDLGPQIHLTNNSVQSRLHIDPGRDHSLPSDNMWENTVFQHYLKEIGKPEVWKEIIYPGMKSAIVTILLSSREHLNQRHGLFHIQGADFMIAEDFHPWLIEINSKPNFCASTKVTAKLCPQCIEDTLKVILDWDKGANPGADTGDWELLYQGKELPQLPALPSGELVRVQGRQIKCSENLT